MRDYSGSPQVPFPDGVASLVEVSFRATGHEAFVLQLGEDVRAFSYEYNSI